MLQDRTLHLYGLVSAETIAPILEEIIRINNEDEQLEWQTLDKKETPLPRKPIHLYINSGGGQVYDCFSLLSAMDASKTPIYTYCHGYVMSAGLTIFVGGHRRFGGIYSQYMFHEPSEDLGKEKYSTLVSRLNETNRVKNIRTNYICDNTKLQVEDFEKNKYIDVFMDVNEALSNGVVHEIIY